MWEKRRVQVTLTLCVGAEPWIRVQHPDGWFKVPADTTVLRVFEGAIRGWMAKPGEKSYSKGTVTMPLDEYLRLRALDV